MAIYTEKFKGATAGILKYMDVIRELARNNGDWKGYDQKFRKMKMQQKLGSLKLQHPRAMHGVNYISPNFHTLYHYLQLYNLRTVLHVSCFESAPYLRYLETNLALVLFRLIHLHCRVPDTEWSFQDGGLYIVKKVGVKILTIIVLKKIWDDDYIEFTALLPEDPDKKKSKAMPVYLESIQNPGCPRDP
jgi:hypothetical protein